MTGAARIGPRRAAGFSVFEVLVAIAVLAVLSGAMWAFLADMARQRERSSALAAQLRSGIVLIERIESDVLTSLAGTSSLGAGVQGSNSELRLLSRGVTPPLGDDAAEVPLGDLQASRFVFDAQRGVLRAGRGDGLSGSETRMRRLTGGLERVRFRYHDGSGWQSSFDSLEAGGLPVAIEVAVWFEPRGGRASDPDGSAGEEADRPADAAADGEAPEGGSGVDSRGVPPMAPGFLESPQGTGEVDVPTRAPDRRRIIVVPDGPEVEAPGVSEGEPSAGAGSGGP